MLIKHETNIDTVAIQLDFINPTEQRDRFNLIYNWIIRAKLGKIEECKNKSNQKVKVYNLINGKNKLATLHTGFSKNYYIRIRWCGLKSFNKKHDKASFTSLMTICAWLNTTGTNYRFVELDIALDMYCPFNKVLAGCINPVNNITYNPIGFVQYYKDVPTKYIEDYRDKKKRKYAMKRSYLYDKSNKESLNSFVTRFEVKLQNRFFLRYGFNLNSIFIALNKYAIFHFNDFKDKRFELQKLKDKKSLNHLELFKLEKRYQRVYYNLTVIEKFIKQVQSVYVDFKGGISFHNSFTNKDFL